MKKAILLLIDNNVKNVDKYVHNGSTWLIFTNDLTWVVEYDRDNTLWYNYKFFQDLFNYVSVDVVDNQEFITEWFESRILKTRPCVEDTIQTGVKNTDFPLSLGHEMVVEDAIQNGVKDTSFVNPYFNQNVEETIQNGVKKTDFPFGLGNERAVEDAIQNGVKETIDLEMDDEKVVKYMIENGVKRTLSNATKNVASIIDTIQSGVKETKTVDDSNIIKYAVDYMYRSGRVTETVENGVKETMWRQVENYPQFVNNVIDKGVKETHHDCYGHEERIKGVILKNTK